MSTAETPLMLGLGAAGILMSPEEFDRADQYDEDYRYELVHGVLVVTPIPSPEETGPNELLGHWLLSYRETHPQGSALDDTLPQQYVRTATSRRLADRLIWAGLGRAPDLRRDVATIAVEFVSAGRRSRHRDYVDKRQQYMEVGIAEYWIIDRFERKLTVVRKQPTGVEELVLHETDVYSTPLLPQFEVPLARLFMAADRRAQHD